MTTQQLKEASRILREEYPKPRISKTVDVYNGLNPTERQILFETQSIYPPRLMENNPKTN
jgi:hypothetical protein